MKKILIIGGGAMGSAFSIPCIDNNHKVFITEPYSQRFIKNLSSKNKFHSALKINLPKKLKFKKYSNKLFYEKYDLIVIALSLTGINFIANELKKFKVKSPILVLTKGLKYEKQNIFFVGRLAEYKYFNMDQAIYSALKLYEQIKK